MQFNKITNINMAGVDYQDYPDFCDAYIDYAEYDGVPLTDAELDKINDNSEFVYESLMNEIF